MRTEKLVMGLVAVAVVGALGRSAVKDLAPPSERRRIEHANARFAGLPMSKQIVDKASEGADDLIFRVDPMAKDNPGLQTDLETYVNAQGEAGHNQLMFGQHVNVPEVSGAE